MNIESLLYFVEGFCFCIVHGVQVRKQPLELDMEQQTSFTLGKEYFKAGYCHPAYLNYMQSASWEMLAG